MKTRLAILLPVILAGVHLLAVGSGLLEGAQNGDGAMGLVLIYLLAGTLVYALIGFLVGAAIDRVRVIIARRWSQD